MTTNPFSDNPYQSPAFSAETASSAISAEDRGILRKFQQQMLALGVLWILLGLFVLAVGIFLLVARPQLAEEFAVSPLVIGIMLVSGTLHFGIGVLTCCKQIVAVYVGLVLGYLSVISNLINLNLCALAILAVILIQAHRVIGWARHLKRQGIALSTKP